MDFLGLYFYEYLFVVFQESVAELKKVAVAAVVEVESYRIWCVAVDELLPQRAVSHYTNSQKSKEECK